MNELAKSARAVPDLTEGSIPECLDELDEMINHLGGAVRNLEDRIKGFLVPEDSDEPAESGPSVPRRRNSDVSERLNLSIVAINQLRYQVNNISERVNV